MENQLNNNQNIEQELQQTHLKKLGTVCGAKFNKYKKKNRECSMFSYGTKEECDKIEKFCC